MKKKKITNRKVITRNRRYVIASIGISIICLTFSLVFALWHFFTPRVYISPLPAPVKVKTQAQIQTDSPAQTILHAFFQAGISYKNITHIDTNSYQITLGDSSIVIVSTAKDLSAQIASLQLITTRLTMEGKRFSRLDLRYDQPVIVF